MGEKVIPEDVADYAEFGRAIEALPQGFQYDKSVRGAVDEKGGRLSWDEDKGEWIPTPANDSYPGLEATRSLPPGFKYNPGVGGGVNATGERLFWDQAKGGWFPP